MAHNEQKQFLLSVKKQFPERFQNCSVLDIGSLDINGNNRYLFSDYSYIGLDIGEGNNVDVVCRGHKYKFEKQFDIVISTECFEHDEFWNLTIENAIKLLKSNGLFMFTCATTGRPEHGTRKTSPYASPFTSQIENDYYKNLTELDIRSKIDIEEHFSKFEFKSYTLNKNKFRHAVVGSAKAEHLNIKGERGRGSNSYKLFGTEEEIYYHTEHPRNWKKIRDKWK